MGEFDFIEIREERPDDIATVRDVNRRAFGQDQESNIVDALRANGGALLSLVATVNDRVVGHNHVQSAIYRWQRYGCGIRPDGGTSGLPTPRNRE